MREIEDKKKLLSELVAVPVEKASQTSIVIFDREKRDFRRFEMRTSIEIDYLPARVDETTPKVEEILIVKASPHRM